jgi:hypothetical protein
MLEGPAEGHHGEPVQYDEHGTGEFVLGSIELRLGAPNANAYQARLVQRDV